MKQANNKNHVLGSIAWVRFSSSSFCILSSESKYLAICKENQWHFINHQIAEEGSEWEATYEYKIYLHSADYSCIPILLTGNVPTNEVELAWSEHYTIYNAFWGFILRNLAEKNGFQKYKGTDLISKL